MTLFQPPPDCFERFGSGATDVGETKTTTTRWIVQGTDDEDAAIALVAGRAPLVSEKGMVRGQIGVEPIGPYLWEATVPYYGLEEEITGAPAQEEELLQPTEYSFETGGGQIRIFQSLETIDRYTAYEGEPIPNYKGALNIKDGRVEGIDIPSQVYLFGETIHPPDGFVTPEYKASVYRLTTRMNSAAWRGFERGEVLFLGATGHGVGLKWSITFNFAASENIEGRTVGEITDITKLGWDYLDVLYHEHWDGEAGMFVFRPAYAKTERVHEFGDFTALGIGP